MEKDYYKILGVGKDASAQEIKSAYRKLAMKYHPDHAKNDRSAEETFKRVSEAYAVLGDAEKRRKYDAFGAEGFKQRFSQEDIFRGFNFGDILREFGFSGEFSMGRGGGRRSTYGGMGPFGAGRAAHPQRSKGQDLVYEIPLTLEEVMEGTSKTVSLRQGGQEKVNVKIPRGMTSGKKLRLAGKGEAGAFGGAPGDLFIQAKVQKHPLFQVEGIDLYTERRIKLTEALLGTRVEVPTPEGKQVTLTVPPGTKHLTKMRLPGYGLPEMHGSARGNLYVRILVDIPRTLKKEQRQWVQKLAESGL